MTVLSAQTIRNLCVPPRHGGFALTAPPFHPMLSPFVERGVTGGRSYGLTCAGYDVRLRRDLLLPPKTMRLGSTIERFDLPANVAARVHDKSSWARRALHVHNTRIEPGWRGWLTLEIKNDSWWFVRLRAGWPLAQVVFEFLDEPTEQAYSGKYQDQPDRPVAAIDELDAVVVAR